MTILKSKEDIRKIRESGNILKEIFEWIESVVAEGISTGELDRRTEDIIRSKNAKPAFKGYRGYPASICASVNEVVVHGIPSDDIILSDGDIIGIDIGVEKDGFFADCARTYAIGTVSEEARRLMEVTKACLDAGVKEAVSRNKIFDISNAIQTTAKNGGFQEVRAFVGHGVGRQLHEPPEVPNWGEAGKGLPLKEGLVLAIEPMINAGTRDVEIMSDDWTAVTRDGKLSAHYEDTIIIGKDKAERIT